MTEIPKRNRSGVRGEGDDYQHLVTLNEALRAMRGNGVVAVTVEADGAGNVDDIVLHDESGPARFTQVKHAVDAKTPVNSDYLLQPTRKGLRSLLQRFRDSWQQLREARTPEMVLVTDRDIDPNDDIFKVLDRRTGRLVPDFADKSLDSERAVWAEHLDTNDEELIDLLGALRFETGRSMAAERELAQVQMEALGLADDQRAVDSAMAFVRGWVQERDRTLTVREVTDALIERVGRRTDPRGLLVVEGIDDHAAGDAADVTVRFVELYLGDEPYSRFELRSPADWQDVVWGDLVGAAATFSGRGLHDVVVAGAMRLPMWFATGCAFRGVEGFNVSTTRLGQEWTSREIGAKPALEVEVVEVGDGSDRRIAVVLSIAADAADAGLAHAKLLGVGTVVLIAPAAGPSSGAISDAPAGTAMAEAIRNAVREHLAPNTTEVHLYLAAPAGLALVLGNRWNRLRQTVVYEHTPAGYVRTLTLPA
jgi:hypothetical protein